MKGLIVMNAYPAGEKFFRQSGRIAEELNKLGVETQVKKNCEIARLISDMGVLTESGYDFAVYLDKDKYLGYALEKGGLRLFNRAVAVEVCDDKTSTYLALCGQNVPIVPTVSAPLCYTQNVTADEDFLRYVGQTLGFPLVVKTSYGSFGAGVYLAKDERELQSLANRFLRVPHLYQAYEKESAGRDLRVIVVGGKAVGAMERRAQDGEFRSNIELGGVGKGVDLDENARAVAERAATVLGLDYCGVDLLLTARGAVVCEVNSNAFFEGFESATGVNVAAAYARHIVTAMKTV